MEPIVQLLRDNVLTPFGFTHPIRTLAFGLWFLEFFGGLFVAFIFPLMDWVTLYAERLLSRNRKIEKIDKKPDPGQVVRELYTSLVAILVIPLMNIPFHVSLELGYGKIYHNITDIGGNYVTGVAYMAFSTVLFYVVSDFFIYWAHRLLHTVPFMYQHLHKLHHSFVWVTPFTAYAFHPVDAWIQSLPYWFMAYIVPMHAIQHVVLLLGVTVWTISIHDRITLTDWKLVNGAGHHWIHHRDFNYNYGQYFTFCDRIFGTYKEPTDPACKDDVKHD